MDSAGRIKVALDYWGAAMYKRENLASLRDVALEGGLPVPDTPVYASSPGVLLLQRQKRRELAEAVRRPSGGHPIRRRVIRYSGSPHTRAISPGCPPRSAWTVSNRASSPNQCSLRKTRTWPRYGAQGRSFEASASHELSAKAVVRTGAGSTPWRCPSRWNTSIHRSRQG